MTRIELYLARLPASLGFLHFVAVAAVGVAVHINLAG